MSFRNIEHKTGDSDSPWRTTKTQENSWLNLLLNLTRNLTLEYILLRSVIILPRIPNCISLDQRLLRWTYPNALLKSMKFHSIFLPWFIICVIIPCRTNTFPEVLIPLRKLEPRCKHCNLQPMTSSGYLRCMRVKSLPNKLSRVIPL